MGLYERWLGTEEPRLPVHAFAAAMREATRGAVTQPQLVTGFGLDVTAQAELALIQATWAAQPTDRAKDAFVTKLHDVMLLVSDGFYTKAKAKTELGF